MIYWDTGTVVAIVSSRESVQELEIAMRGGSGAKARAIHYTDAFGPVGLGDTVVLNTTAVQLDLGTGGRHFVLSVLRPLHGSEVAAEEAAALKARTIEERKGHLMKLRYTPLQRSVLAAEEQASPHHGLFQDSFDLEGMPVLIGELHSMLPAAVCWLRHAHAVGADGGSDDAHGGKKPLRIVYIMSDGGALPIAYSRHVSSMRERGWLAGTVTFGHAYGGDVEAINKFTALIAAKRVLKADVAIVAMGPGIAGTGTPLGHTGVEVGELVNAAAALGGKPVVMPRISFAESRDRHRGISHHLLHSLSLIALREAALPLPDSLNGHHKQLIREQLESSGLHQKHRIVWVRNINRQEIARSQESYPLPVTTMGRGLAEDPGFFLGVCSAAQYVLDGMPSES
ncbi:DUF3866 family protein [Ferviditalea candida]|uniref:DUF3866 family protein n=1 Tax=Ferviditalea candida TaxID=3108399 RepID=A0ABU5ZJQ8_9BACL|nr:DUF3866 family protein [Paenibacillaceae bacterium T2]